jgi:hypothetical protein
MWTKWGRLLPSRGVLRKIMMVVCVAGIAVGAFFWGRQVALSQTRASNANTEFDHYVPVKSPGSSDYRNRVVAYIYGNVPISREELGEFLITRLGEERVEGLVNRRILDMAAQRLKVHVTEAEVQDQLREELKTLGSGISEKDFANQILKRFNKSIYEWKEDVIKPRILLSKMVRPQITVTPLDVQKGFEAKFGPKVKCRMIVLAASDKGHWSQVWDKVSKSEEEFRNAASGQFIQALAAGGGVVPPIHKHFGDANLETEAFRLKKGQVSSVVEMPDGTGVILKCDDHIPADGSARIEDERLALHREIEQFKLNQKIPEFFQLLRREAAPSILLKSQIRQDDLERAVQRELNPRAPEAKAPNMLPTSPPMDTTKLQGPPPGSTVNIEDVPSRPIPPPGSFKITEPPPPASSLLTPGVNGPTGTINTGIPKIAPIGTAPQGN